MHKPENLWGTSGDFYTQQGNLFLNTKTGDFSQPWDHGLINLRTGQFSPVVGNFVEPLNDPLVLPNQASRRHVTSSPSVPECDENRVTSREANPVSDESWLAGAVGALAFAALLVIIVGSLTLH
jgi:hypothetical protein